MIRWFGALFLALLISVGLFWFMQWMVMNNDSGLQKTSNQQLVDFIRIQKDTAINKKQRRLKPKPQPEPPNKPKLVRSQPTKPLQSPAPQMDMPNIDIPMTSPRLSANLSQAMPVQKRMPSANPELGQPSGGLIPIVTSKPRYPLRAQSRNIEGWVVVEFTITPTGSVIDAKVTDAKPEGTFDRAALNAIVKWKFKPKIENSRPVAQRAVQRLEFNVDGDGRRR
ncbi:MAG: energy transducer TonB [Methylococcales bacterium]